MSGEEYQAYNTYNELIAALKSLCRARDSGTMYIATPDNQFARIVLKDGEIISLSFRTKNGAEALPLIRGIAGGRFKFSAGQMSADEEHMLPAGFDAMRLLVSDEVGAGGGADRAVPADRMVRAPKIIEQQLAEFLGPIAGIVCEEYLTKLGAPRSTTDLNDLLEALAREIGDPIKARRFKEQVWVKLTA